MKRVYTTPLCEPVRISQNSDIMEEQLQIGSHDATTSGEAKQNMWMNDDDGNQPLYPEHHRIWED